MSTYLPKSTSFVPAGTDLGVKLLRAETREEIRKESATKIHGQPTDQDLTLLEKELISIAANTPTALGGGNH